MLKSSASIIFPIERPPIIISFGLLTEKNFESPITTKPWGEYIPKLAEKEIPSNDDLDSELLYSEPNGLNIDTGLPKIDKTSFKRGVYY